MNVLYLSVDSIMKITKEPSLYEKFPFLNPMKDSALRVHAQIGRYGCNSCGKAARHRAASFIANAFMNLVSKEGSKQPNSLVELKAAMASILNSQIDEVRMTWVKGAQNGEFKF